MRGPEYYQKKYAIGVIDVSNSLEIYNRFLVNAGELKPLEEFITDSLRFKKKIRVLDIGCGNAGALHELKKQFKKKIETIGIDLIPFPKKNADLALIGNALELNWPAGIDLVFSFRALHEFANAHLLVLKTSQVLAPSGTALLLFRLRNVVNQTVEWSGEMTQSDESFLFNLAQTRHYEHCTVFSKIAFEKLADGSETPVGILIKLKKSEK